MEPVLTVDCEKAADSIYKTYSLAGKPIRYLVFSIEKSKSIDQTINHNGIGSVLLPNLSSLSLTDKKIIANSIMTAYKLKKITLFESCDVVTLHYRALEHSKEEKKRLEKSVAYFEWQNK
jgi:hypothetical protein